MAKLKEFYGDEKEFDQLLNKMLYGMEFGSACFTSFSSQLWCYYV